MIIITKYIKEKVQEFFGIRIIAKDKDHLMSLISREIKKNGYECDLNHIDVAQITEMEELFHVSDLFRFNGNISKWDVSNVEDMQGMFHETNFNGDISKWDVSKVKNMRGMFWKSSFNRDISHWDISKVEYMEFMFSDLAENKPYWFNYENKEERNIAIERYKLAKELGEDLTENKTREKKLKI
jgi:surface protein